MINEKGFGKIWKLIQLLYCFCKKCGEMNMEIYIYYTCGQKIKEHVWMSIYLLHNSL